MNRNLFAVFILTFSFLFAMQTIEISALRANPKTCCGRVICLCKHGAGKACPIKSGLKKAAEHEDKHAMPCHRKSAPAQSVKKDIPSSGSGFTKAPCASDSPKTLLPNVIKHYLTPDILPHRHSFLQTDFSSASKDPLISRLLQMGIDRPPRIF